MDVGFFVWQFGGDTSLILPILLCKLPHDDGVSWSVVQKGGVQIKQQPFAATVLDDVIKQRGRSQHYLLHRTHQHIMVFLTHRRAMLNPIIIKIPFFIQYIDCSDDVLLHDGDV